MFGQNDKIPNNQSGVYKIEESISMGLDSTQSSSKSNFESQAICKDKRNNNSSVPIIDDASIISMSESKKEKNRVKVKVNSEGILRQLS